ncbi:dimethyl sulfoxide reductase anchor subunit [Puniceicoccaceae bacterium K14]|nr:dimethyl sulfoxide reductase anchor subunit [Puniceicoccaceae bacterium K14]
MGDIIELKDKTLIDMLLEEQKQIDTPVGRFADEAEEKAGDLPYQGLIPLSAPKPGEQFAFEVNLDKCSGCKGCVTACHSLNGLDENETWRDVGLLVGGTESHPFQQTVTTACHHCVDPACLNGCPVNAYEKDPISGIVLHLDDQCIGCQYCVLKCPYDVPKYSSKRGIVRKCDMCHSRLSVGEAPACVQACPHEAIKITTVSQEERQEASKDKASFLPGSPEPDYTVPTTRYISDKNLPSNFEAADKHVLRPQHTHWPLVGLLALSQIGIGGFVVAATSSFHNLVSQFWGLAISWAIMHAGLTCSVLHLGQPLKAWRIFLGFRKSWLSREAIALTGVSGLASASLGLSAYGLWFNEPIIDTSLFLKPTLITTALFGLIGVLTSVYIYVDTQRLFWKLSSTASKFYGSVAVGGLAIGTFAQSLQGGGKLTAVLLIAASAIKLAVELKARSQNATTLALSKGPLKPLWKARLGLAIASGILLPILFFFLPSLLLSALLLIAVTSSEVAERVFYFKAVDSPKMPGSITI